MKCSTENRGLGEISFCYLAVINQPPPELLPPGVLQLLNYQAERNSIIQESNSYMFPVLSCSSPLFFEVINELYLIQSFQELGSYRTV
jgi:hypothetical protein